MSKPLTNSQIRKRAALAIEVWNKENGADAPNSITIGPDGTVTVKAVHIDTDNDNDADDLKRYV